MSEVTMLSPFYPTLLFNNNSTTVRKSLPRFSSSQLTSTKILAQRSAVSAVFSRPNGSSITTKRKVGALSHDEKGRLLRIGKRMRKGPLNSYIDPTEFGAGSAILEVSEAARKSGRYDAWADVGGNEEEVKDGLETVRKVEVKVRFYR
jgi:nucleolar protein 53